MTNENQEAMDQINAAFAKAGEAAVQVDFAGAQSFSIDDDPSLIFRLFFTPTDGKTPTICVDLNEQDATMLRQMIATLPKTDDLLRSVDEDIVAMPIHKPEPDA